MHTEQQFDAVVIGGGLLGCFAARNLTRYNISVALIEMRENVCTGISKANTAIVYTGADTKPGTLKTELCVHACRGFDKLCDELGVHFKRCGSLMLSYGPKADERLKKKYEMGLENGVEGLRLISGDEAMSLEPNIAPGVSSAIYAPGTGTVIPWELCIAAYENALANGCAPFLNTFVSNIEANENGYSIFTDNGIINARAVVNCGGLNAHTIQEHITEPTVRVIPDKADYLVLDDTAGSFVSHVIFHEPEEKGKGLTLVPTTDGKLLVGPSEQPGDGSESFSTTKMGLDTLHDLCSRIVPSLDLSQTIRSFGALRPNPYFVSFENGEWKAEERSINNFTITSPLPGFFSLIGIKTPGLTCANELGYYIANQVAEHLAPTELNHSFNPVRSAPISVRHLSFEDRAKLAEKNPAYAKIICRCGDVTEGEVIDAIRRGAVTIDAVKHRVGTGLGRCQGSFCTDRIMKLIERESGLSPYEISKCGRGSEILGGNSDETL